MQTRGFFSKEVLEQAISISPDQLCATKCGLYKTCRSPRMPHSGYGDKGILIIAEAPGEIEDKRDEPLVGKAGMFLSKKLDKICNINMNEDCWKHNSLSCRPPKNRTPLPHEIEACRPRVMDLIKKLKPSKILCLGKPAFDSLYRHRVQGDLLKGSFAKWVGKAIPDHLFGCYVFPAYHPSYIMRNREGKNVDPNIEASFDDCLVQMVEHDTPYPELWRDDDKSVVSLMSAQDIDDFLDSIYGKTTLAAVDFETSGTKPYGPVKHFLKSLSICYDGITSYAFPYLEANKKAIQRFLTSTRIGKIAQNIRMEHTWSRHMLGVIPEPWDWDTMVASHCLDNQPGITGLKFQAMVRFGAVAYNKEVEHLLKTVDPATGLNQINKVPMNVLLQYGGLDSLYTYRLAALQKQEMDEQEREAYCQIMHPGIVALSNVQHNGILIDAPYYEEKSKELAAQEEECKKEIHNTPEAKLWLKKKGRQINPKSGPQMSELLFGILKETSVKETTSGKESVDEAVLEALKDKYDICGMIVKVRGLNKTRKTNVLGILGHADEHDIVRPNYGLDHVVTFRGSCDAPNFQNIPVRDPIVGELVRSGIIAEEDSMLGETDYGGIEVRMSGCNTEDPVLIDYLFDDTKDMHRDTAMSLWLLPQSEVTKPLRQLAKSEAVFAWFYGSFYLKTAHDTWPKLKDMTTVSGKTVKQHLADKGIRSLDAYEVHLKKAEKHFWDRFAVYAKWKEKTREFYDRHGYIRLLTGLKCHAPLSRNDLLNYPNQGPAFHCLLWSLARLEQKWREEKKRTLIIGQIHDSIVKNIYPPELDVVKKDLVQVMTKDIVKAMPWIIVPLKVELELTPVGGNWWEKKGVEI